MESTDGKNKDSNKKLDASGKKISISGSRELIIRFVKYGSQSAQQQQRKVHFELPENVNSV